MTTIQLKYTILGLLALTLALTSCKEKPVKTESVAVEKPNLLFIFPDQWRNAAVGINNEDPVLTPNLDQLAREGILFSNAISNYPLCSPFRGMLMTGKLPYNNKILTNANSGRYKYGNSWQKDDISFSDVLVKNGYDAGYVGKLHLTSPAPIQGKDTVVWDAYTPMDERHSFNFWYAYGAFDQHLEPHYWVNNAKENEVKYVKKWSPQHEADVIIDYLENANDSIRNGKKPFALFWSINPPHPPYQYVPEKYLKPYQNKTHDELLVRKNVDLNTDAKALAFHKGTTRKRTHLAKEHVKEYFAAVTGVDEQIGRVLKTLKEQGLDKNTIVVITADHGEMMGSHGLMSKNNWFEEAINVPLIIRWPKKIPGNQKQDVLVSSTDFMPTLLNMMEAANGLPDDLDGQDLSSYILTGKGKKPQVAPYYYIKEGQPDSGHRGIRTYKNTYVITIDDSGKIRKLLYDNINDPYQTKNIIGKNDRLENQLNEQLMSLLTEKKDPWLARYKSLTKDKK